jgi:predicted HTH transcriptional regulator
MKPWVEHAQSLLRSSLEPPQHELNELDWKVGLSVDKHRLVEHLCAFANYPGGGYLVYGIDSNALLTGVTLADIENITNQLANLGREAIEPPIQLDHMGLHFQGCDVLLICVPESAFKPVHRRARPIDESYIRSGGTTRAASRQEIGSMMLHSKTPRWEDLQASLLMSDEKMLDILEVDPIFKLLDQPAFVNAEERLEWMAGEGFIERHASGGGYVTNLGAISAARRLESFQGLSRKAARVIVYEGVSKAKTRQETEGAMGYALSFQRLISFVSALLPKSEVIEQALRQSRTLYPELALREIIANALIHQDFTISGAGPLIEIYDDRIEVSNPGKLLPSKRLDRLIGTQPESRNEKLARAFRRYRICEERGSGLLKAGFEVELYGLPPIKFEQESEHFKVTLFAPRTFAQMSATERLNACYQHAVLRYYSSSAMTNKSLRERLKMPEKQRSMVSVLIQEAMDKGLIVAANPENKSKKFAEYVPGWAGTQRI